MTNDCGDDPTAPGAPAPLDDPGAPGQAQLDDDDSLDDDDLVDVIDLEAQKRLWLRATLPYLQLRPPEGADDAVDRAFALVTIAAATRAARILRSDMVDDRPA